MVVRVLKAQGEEACPDGYWALYDDAQFNRTGGWGRVLISNQDVPDLKVFGFNDNASSVVNKAGRNLELHEDTDYQGEWGLFGGKAADLTQIRLKAEDRPNGMGGTYQADVSFNDAVSSVRFRVMPAEAGDYKQVRDGTYTLTNVGSGKVLEVSGSGAGDGANVLQRESTGLDNQKWRITSTQRGVATLTAVHSGKVLDVSDASTRDGANVQQWTPNNSYAQQWWLTPLGNDVFVISNLRSGKVLDVSNGSTENGANVQQYEFNDTNAQKWRLQRV
jgi:hypothetical protein